ncbi:hypothetical protein GCM10017709_34150 [Glutamicibacter nicotianae]
MEAMTTMAVANMPMAGAIGTTTKFITRASTIAMTVGRRDFMATMHCTRTAPISDGRMYRRATSMTSAGIMDTSQVPSRPTNSSKLVRWTVAAPQMAITAARSPRLVPGLAPMVDCATMAAGSSLLEMLPIMKAWYMAAEPRMGK